MNKIIKITAHENLSKHYQPKQDRTKQSNKAKRTSKFCHNAKRASQLYDLYYD
jgi:hypothetical protein